MHKAGGETETHWCSLLMGMQLIQLYRVGCSHVYYEQFFTRCGLVCDLFGALDALLEGQFDSQHP